MTEPTTTQTAARAIAAADQVLVLSGAGISAESGIPTFREAQTGLWAQYGVQDLATPDAFAEDPARVWAWYRWRRTLIARGGINPGHRALVALARQAELSIATQNVDGLHAAAGSSVIAELHGNIWCERCTQCAHETRTAVDIADDTAPLPACSRCGGLTRPGVVWFGETLPARAMNHAQRALERADCVIVVGTSNQVYPAAALVDTAVAGPATVIEINPQATSASERVDIRIADTSSRALPAIVSALDAMHAAG